MVKHQELWGGFLGRTLVRVGMLASVVLATTMAVAQPTTATSIASDAHTALFARLDTDGNGKLITPEVPSEHKRLFDRLLRRADLNRDQALSREEFFAGLVSNQPEKPIEEKQPAELPGANAIRWLLLSMDTDRDGALTESEVPANLRTAYQTLISQLDRDQSGVLERMEMSQLGRQLSNIATRIAAQMQVDVDAELAKLKQSQGTAFDRFEGQRGMPPERLMNNPRQARQMFIQWDKNRNGQVTLAEVPEAERTTFRQMLQAADRDGNGQLTEQEVLASSRRGGPRNGNGRGRRGGPQSVIDAVQPARFGDSKPGATMDEQGMGSEPKTDGMSGKDR